ncbi:YIP1 family protein [Chondromyces crocatus]|uniref:Yip1 domain-containing protein n=1 Tax=Chondromyces crocatus TaxID=52 RepID=A0A0K1E5D6_CHOCO|nr:YIP1 family protein [Chondromyces crocatus]AKT36075.1 uncharacterized protein CMC5_001880 [Chondromyces crocatus]
MIRTLAGLLLHPRKTLGALAQAGDPRDGLVPVLLLGALYAAFALLLHLGGHAPSVTLVPIPRDRYYLWQAGFVAPLFVALWWIYGLTAHGLSRLAGGRGDRGATFAVIGVGYAVPVTVFFVLPDLIVYLVAGHGALARAMPFYAPLALFGVLTLCALGLRAVHGLSPARAALVSLTGFVLQGAAGGILLR